MDQNGQEQSVQELERRLESLRSSTEQPAKPQIPRISQDIPTQTPRRRPPKILLFVPIAVLIVVLVVLVITNLNRSTSEEVKDESVQELIDTNVYTNQKYNYTINYPKNFSIMSVPGTDLPEAFYSESDDISFSGGVREDDPSSEIIFGVRVDPTDEVGKVMFCLNDEDCLIGWLQIIGESQDGVNFINTQILGREVQGVEIKEEVEESIQVKRYFALFEENHVFVISVIVNNYPEVDIGNVFEEFSKYISSFKLE